MTAETVFMFLSCPPGQAFLSSAASSPGFSWLAVSSLPFFSATPVSPGAPRWTGLCRKRPLSPEGSLGLWSGWSRGIGSDGTREEEKKKDLELREGGLPHPESFAGIGATREKHLGRRRSVVRD